MSADIIELADSLKSLITAAPLPLDATVERVYVPENALTNLKALKIAVAPAAISRKAASRADTERRNEIHVAVVKQVKGTDLESIDELVNFVEELADFLDEHRRNATAVGVAKIVEVQNDPIYSPDHLAEKSTFLSLIRVTLRVVR